MEQVYRWRKRRPSSSHLGVGHVSKIAAITRGPAESGFGGDGLIRGNGPIPKGGPSEVLERLYLEEASSTMFGIKLGTHNVIEKITTFE